MTVSFAVEDITYFVASTIVLILWGWLALKIGKEADDRRRRYLSYILFGASPIGFVTIAVGIVKFFTSIFS